MHPRSHILRAPRRSRRSAARAGQSGFTLVEIAVCFAVLAVAMSVMLQGMVSLTRARQIAAERHRAATTLSRAVETLQALGPTDAFTKYATDAGSGSPFVAAGLQPAGGAEEAVVEIVFFVDETMTDSALGLPRDLDGDGSVASSDVSEIGSDGKVAATMLPARLTVRWNSYDGTPRSLAWTAMITET